RRHRDARRDGVTGRLPDVRNDLAVLLLVGQQEGGGVEDGEGREVFERIVDDERFGEEGGEEVGVQRQRSQGEPVRALVAKAMNPVESANGVCRYTTAGNEENTEGGGFFCSH